MSGADPDRRPTRKPAGGPPLDALTSLQWAAGLLVLLGVMFTLFGGLLLLPALWTRAELFVLLYSLLLVTPGVAYLVLAWFLWRGQRWATTAGLAVVVLQLLTAVALAGVSLVYLSMGVLEWLLLGLWVGVLLWAGVWLVRCRRMPDTHAGFEVLVPVQPPGGSTPAGRQTDAGSSKTISGS